MVSGPPRRLGEFAVIAKFFAPLAAKAGGAFGLVDDVATFAVPRGHESVLKVDTIVEGVHFLRDDPAGLVAKKALRVNLSDLAAKGAVAKGYLLSLSLAPWCGDDWLESFAAGLAEDQGRYGIALFGGDTTATSGALTISVTALGIIETGRTIRRAGAKAGDLVFTTGTIGDAGGGLAVLNGEGAQLGSAGRDYLIGRYRLPEPRATLGPRLVGVASASLDVSDGLIADLKHLADVSGVRIAIDAARVPLSPPLLRMWGAGAAAVVRAATAGDDYEIAFTAPPSARELIQAIAKDSRTEIHEIGRVDEGAGAVLRDEAGRPIPLGRLGFTHF